MALQVEQNASCLQAGPELKQAVEGQRGDMRLAPSFSSLLHFLLKLHPPTEMDKKLVWLWNSVNEVVLFDCLRRDRMINLSKFTSAKQQDVM